MDVVPNHPDARRALRGQLVREEVYGEDQTPQARLPYAVQHHVYTVQAAVGPPLDQEPSFFVARTATRAMHTERGVEPRTVETTSRYGAYGRLVESRERGIGRDGSFATDHEAQQTQTLERLVRTTYHTLDVPTGADVDGPYSPAYLVDWPAETARLGAEGGVETLLGREVRYYDGDAYEGLGYPGSGTTAGVTRGRLSCRLELALTDALLDATYDSGWGAQAALSDRGQYLVVGTDHFRHAERYAYDARGMRVGAKDARGNASGVTYDGTFGLFAVGALDAAGHPTTLERGEFPFQVVASEDPNGNRTEYTWDPSGLPASRSVMGKSVGGAWQGDPPTHPTETYAYAFDAVPAAITVQRRQARLGATYDEHRYLDGLGRAVQERHTAEPHPSTGATRFRVTGWRTFDPKGQVIRAYPPTFAPSSDYAAGDTSVPYIATTYDLLGQRVDDGTQGPDDEPDKVPTYSRDKGWAPAAGWYRWMENECAVAADEDNTVELDWARFYWDLYTEGPVSVGKILDIWRDADP